MHRAEVSLQCGYGGKEIFRSIDDHYDQIIGKLVGMIDNPRPWLIPGDK
jgi:hypothetical protein